MFENYTAFFEIPDIRTDYFYSKRTKILIINFLGNFHEDTFIKQQRAMENSNANQAVSDNQSSKTTNKADSQQTTKLGSGMKGGK